MTETTAPMAGVAMTAIGVAVIRARESARPDRLYDDPLASRFVEAARRFYTATPDGALRWERLEALADKFFEGRTVGVRLVDDRMNEAVEAGCRQIVVLGAGLDTRAFRLALPANLRFFEIDLPELFAFKEPVLAAANPTPRCIRAVIPADLRENWSEQLRARGFREQEPTYWVEEGVLGYLGGETALRVAATLTELSAPGSRFGAGRFRVDRSQEHYAELGRLVGGEHDHPDRVPGSFEQDAEQWLAAHGWRTSFRSWDELVAPLDRPVTNGDPDIGLIEAVRE
ncbi:methyltransferase (TIGR00027 family) [Nocardia tenerifensis]|uniref:S-adenosyl-L-methionine-dependent methyltransferase n=1 Tax=Nocardia tenerifensis TaxID=228006 RepID=A0A318JWN3_9NOCA|nr:SAM-dependent methyltransferase [Nocardia tenerifensis]PXX57879.1 methyltransferase (TIGR00027 family) [Nocardia tenerifensis]